MVSATVTCPLDVVKTRLQSAQMRKAQRALDNCSVHPYRPQLHVTALSYQSANYPRSGPISGSLLSRWSFVPRFTVLKHIREIVAMEGVTALWKGLVPTLMGIVPSRAIYFCAYHEAKQYLEQMLTPGSTPVHVLSAACSGFITTTIANPIWMIRTRMQLDHGAGQQRINIRKCIRQVYSEYGARGFLKGVTASYAGLCETVLHFGVYEKLKVLYLASYPMHMSTPHSLHYPVMMLCGGTARLIATCISYPHEVVRTRLREKASVYHGFFQTLIKIYQTESWRGLYSGICVHLMKTVPNSAVLMATYELTVSFLKTQTA